MAEFFLRPATEADFHEIKSLVWKARINPTKLDWRRFTVAVDEPILFTNEPQEHVSSGTEADVIGCVQLKPVPRDITELASLVVHPDYRGQGIARALIENILVDAPRPVYLTCRSGLGKFYEKFGFQVLGNGEMPEYYRRLHGLAGRFMELMHWNETLLVMKLG